MRTTIVPATRRGEARLIPPQLAVASEGGFTLVELMVASTITLVVMAVAFASFSNALALNNTVATLADSSQNLRAGTNLLVRDLMQAGRDLPIGGISIPSGAAARPIERPGPVGTSYHFDNTTATAIQSVTTGGSMGPAINGRNTDIVTVLTEDPLCCIVQASPQLLDGLDLYPSDAPNGKPRLALDGASFSVGTSTAWLAGDTSDGIAPIQPGDLIYFNAATGSTIQTVTRVESGTVFFDASDPFNFNQRTATAGSITQILPPSPSVSPCRSVCGPVMSARRLLMFTYYVEEQTPGLPRLMRALNKFPAIALAGVVEDLTLSYDLVDGVTNPVNVEQLPYTANGVTYSASQIRKVNVHVGVRSETKSPRTRDYMRSYLSTVVSLRNLAYVDRYQ